MHAFQLLSTCTLCGTGIAGPITFIFGEGVVCDVCLASPLLADLPDPDDEAYRDLTGGRP